MSLIIIECELAITLPSAKLNRVPSHTTGVFFPTIKQYGSAYDWLNF